MAQGSFTATVSAWVAKTKERTVAVRNESAQRVVEVMQTPRALGGNMRVDTGFLRASLVANIGTGVPTLVDRPKDQGPVTYDPGEINLVIAGAKIDDVLTIAYAANYARAREYLGDRFVGLAAQQWPRIVSETAALAENIGTGFVPAASSFQTGG